MKTTAEHFAASADLCLLQDHLRCEMQRAGAAISFSDGSPEVRMRRFWSATIGWSSLHVNAWSASDLLALCFSALVDVIPEHYAA